MEKREKRGGGDGERLRNGPREEKNRGGGGRWKEGRKKAVAEARYSMKLEAVCYIHRSSHFLSSCERY